MPVVDPTAVRVSDTLLLSDLIGCDSVYRLGYSNPFRLPEDAEKLNEAKKLGALLDTLQMELGPCAVSYGYISPGLSRRIVKYQDPDKPSYHRWDLGAAADVWFHTKPYAPISLVAREEPVVVDYARWITYSESPWMCIATSIGEGNRRALYENRYVGEKRPQFIRYPANARKRAEMLEEAKEEVIGNWTGRGWPSYHGGGRKQFHHEHAAPGVPLSTLLYNARMASSGARNGPPPRSTEARERFDGYAFTAGKWVAAIEHAFQRRVSVVQAWVRDSDQSGNWLRDGPSVSLVMPVGVDPYEAADAASGMRTVKEVRVVNTRKGMTRVKIYGER